MSAPQSIFNQPNQVSSTSHWKKFVKWGAAVLVVMGSCGGVISIKKQTLDEHEKTQQKWEEVQRDGIQPLATNLINGKPFDWSQVKKVTSFKIPPNEENYFGSQGCKIEDVNHNQASFAVPGDLKAEFSCQRLQKNKVFQKGYEAFQVTQAESTRRER